MTFNIVSYDNGTAVDVPQDKVRIYHKPRTSGSFTASPMIKTGNTFTYTFTGSYIDVLYYIEAQENRWDGNYYKGFRPYHDRLSVPPPAENCFSITLGFARALEGSVSQDSCELQVAVPWTPLSESVQHGLANNNVSLLGKVLKVQDDGSIVVQDVKGGETLSKNSEGTMSVSSVLDRGKLYQVKLMFDGTPQVGELYRVKGQLDHRAGTIMVYDPLFFAVYYEETN